MKWNFNEINYIETMLQSFHCDILGIRMRWDSGEMKSGNVKGM